MTIARTTHESARNTLDNLANRDCQPVVFLARALWSERQFQIGWVERWWNCCAWMWWWFKCLSACTCNFRSLAQCDNFVADETHSVFSSTQPFIAMETVFLCLCPLSRFASDGFPSPRHYVHRFRPNENQKECIPSKWHSNRTTHREMDGKRQNVCTKMNRRF